MSTHCQRRLAQSVFLLLCCAISDCVRGDVLSPLNFPSLGTLNLAGGSFTIDTDALTIYDNAAPGTPLFTGVVDDQGGMALAGVVPEIAVFAFDAIDLDSTATVTITGTRAIALLSHSDATIGTALSVDGQASTAAGTEGAVSPGGFAGGVGVRQPGDGPGGGQPNISGSNTWSIAAGMGSFGGAGPYMGMPGDAQYSAPGETYGDLMQLLQGGSGGASSNQHGAGGGGAIELGAVGTLRIEAPVSARGGNATTTPFFAVPGAGSGGGILLSGADVVLDALVSAPGGSVSSTFNTVPKAAGGGRVLIHGGPSTTTLNALEVAAQYLVNVDVKSTTPAYNSNPTLGPLVSRVNQGVISLSPNLTLVGDGETLALGQPYDLSTPTENIELVHRDTRFGMGATAEFSSTYSNPYLIELAHPTARIVGGTLFNVGELRGTGSIETLVSNVPGGQINAVNATQTYFYEVFNNPNAQINAINSTLSFDTWLESTGEVNLINSTVHGDFINNGVASLAGTNTFTGTVSGSGLFTGTGTASFAGVLAPGNSPGALSFGGDVVLQPAATLAIEIGGTEPGVSFDRVEVGGMANLMGTLDVTLAGGFTPTLGDSFGFLFASGGFSSGFSALNLPDISSLGLNWQLNPGGATISLNVVSAPLPGDFDNDSDVDGRDFLVWQRGESPNPLSASDLADWQANFGAGSLVASIAVPEPATLLLLTGGLLVAMRRVCAARFAGASRRG